MKTYLAKVGEIQPEHILFDASEAPVGRLAVAIANALRGKDKPTYTPHIDTGACVIVINASKAVFTGRKATEAMSVMRCCFLSFVVNLLDIYQVLKHGYLHSGCHVT